MSEAVKEKRVKQATIDRVEVVREYLYDFDVDGGAAGAISLKGAHGSASTLPAGTIITDCVTKCVTALTSGGGATVALGITGSATGIEGATAYSDGSYSAANAMDRKTPSAPLLVSTADSAVLLTIATAALTAGKVRVFVKMLLP